MRIGFLGALAILFIALKLCGVVAWSWLWVLAPLWIPAALCVAIPLAGIGLMLGALGLGLLIGACKGRKPAAPTFNRDAIYRKFYGRKRK
jgi:hypothetical protein